MKPRAAPSEQGARQISTVLKADARVEIKTHFFIEWKIESWDCSRRQFTQEFKLAAVRGRYCPKSLGSFDCAGEIAAKRTGFAALSFTEVAGLP